MRLFTHNCRARFNKTVRSRIEAFLRFDSMLKRHFLTPLVPVCCLLLLNIWTIMDETTGPARIIDDSPDDAPRSAAIFLIFLSPILYVAFALLNWIDGCFDRFHRPSNWAASGAITIGLALLFVPVFYRPKVDSSPMIGIMMSCGTAAFAIWPMCLLRRLVFSRHKTDGVTSPSPNSIPGSPTSGQVSIHETEPGADGNRPSAGQSPDKC